MLMKTSSKRKRTREELEEVKQEEEELRGDKQSFLQEVKRLKQEHAVMLQTLQAAQIQHHMQEENPMENQQQLGLNQFSI